MNRRSPYLVSALMSLCVGCGARSNLLDGDDTDGVGGSNSSSHSTTSVAVSGGSTGSGGMCNTPPPPSATMPTQPGCYTNMMEAGWVAVPCACDLWLENTLHASVNASIELSLTPSDLEPTLDGMVDVEIAFDDPDASWFAIWAHQPGNGSAFSVTNDGGATTVRMGQTDLTLLPVPVPECTTRKGVAHIFGADYMAKLDMHAVLDQGGMSLPPVDNFCSNPPPNPPPE